MNQRGEYKRDLEIDIPYFDRLPKSSQDYIEKRILSVIYDSFVVTADQDYLAARFLAQNMLDRAFFWSAAQALEKYMKAYLLFDAQSVDGVDHNLEELWGRVARKDCSLKNIDLSPHPDSSVELERLGKLRRLKVGSFISQVGEFGSPKNRYNSSGVSFFSWHQYALDSFVYHFRSKLRCLPIYSSFQHLTENAVRGFAADNPYFKLPDDSDYFRKLRKPGLVRSSDACTALQFLKRPGADCDDKRALEWLRKRMKV